MNVSKIMGCYEAFLLLEDEDVRDEVLLDRWVVVARPYLTLLILSKGSECVEYDLIASALYLGTLRALLALGCACGCS